MIFRVSQKQAADYMARLANKKARRVMEYQAGADKKIEATECEIIPHATYFEWQATEPKDGGRCYYTDADRIEAVKNDRGDILRLCFIYKFMGLEHIISYEEA